MGLSCGANRGEEDKQDLGAKGTSGDGWGWEAWGKRTGMGATEAD